MAASSEILKEELPSNIIMKDYNTYYCKCCCCVLVGLSCMKQHAVGKRHKKEMQRIGAVIGPPPDETAGADAKPIKSSNSSKLPCGIIESKDKWNSFHCTYCDCELGAGDLNLHVGGKRHTKKANNAALEHFINKCGRNTSSKTDDNVPKKDEEAASETSDFIVTTSQRNALAKASPKSGDLQSSMTEISAVKSTQQSDALLLASPEANTYVKNSSQTNVSVETILETNVISERIAEENTPIEVSSQINSSERSFSQANSSLKVSTQTEKSVKTVTPTNSSTNISVKEETSGKPSALADAIVKNTSQTIDIEKMPQTNESVKTNSEINYSGDAAQQMASTEAIPSDKDNSSVKVASAVSSVTTDMETNATMTTSQKDDSVKTASQANTSMKDIPQTKVKVVHEASASVKTASQTNASVKEDLKGKVNVVPQMSVSAKSTSQTSTPVKASPVIKTKNISGNTTSDSKASLKAMPQTSVKDTLQQKTSVKANPQTANPVKVTSPQTKISLNEYFATSLNPVVGLNYVVETQMSNGQSTFQCKLCKFSGDTCMMKDHINAAKHHLEYLKTVDPIKAAEIKALKETERNKKVLELVTELEKIKGRGTILVKSAETKAITDTKYDQDYLKKSTDIAVKKIENYASDGDNTEDSAIQIVAQEFLTKDMICNAQRKDPKTSSIIKELMDDVPNPSYIMHDDILYEKRNGKYRVVVAQTMKQAIYESYHFSLCRKTPGAITYINDSYSWSGINEDISKFAKHCYVCQIKKLRQLSDGEAIPILVRRGPRKKASSPVKQGFSDLTNEELENTQRGDPDIMKLIDDIENGLGTSKYILYANILYRLDEKGQYKIVVSPQMKKLIFEKNHSVLCWKSTERPPVINAITKVYFWQRMLEEVKLFAAKCKKCRINIPVKRILDQKISIPASAKISKKSTEKIHREKNKDEPKEKTQKSKIKEKVREVHKEKSSKNSSWDKTKSLKPPIVEQDILSKDMIRDAQKKDLTTSKIIKLLMDGVPSSNYIIYEGILYQEKNERYLTMVADKMKQAIYEKCHSSLCTRYTGRSYQRDGTKYISRHFSWPALSQDIYIFVKNCHVCQVKTLRTKAFSHLSSGDHYNNTVLTPASRPAFTDLTDDEISAAQQNDPDTLKILHQIEDGLYISRHILYEDILYCQDGRGDYKVVITPEMKEMIYQNNHFLICWESTVWQSTVDTISQVYLWPRIYEDIRDLMESCQVCKREFPEQSYIDPMASVDLLEQYPSTYTDPAYYSPYQQYQSNYPVESVDPYSAANTAAYSQYWNTSPDAVVGYPALGSGSSYCENTILDAKEQGYSLNSGKRSANDDDEDSLDSYNQRKRHRFDVDYEYEYPRSQDDRHLLPSFEGQMQLDQSPTLSPSRFQHSPLPSVGSHSEFSQPIEAENSNSANALGFTIANADDAEVTLDIINSLMHIYLKYQLKKLRGPIQKLLQESFKDEDNSNTTSLPENAVSDNSDDVTDTDTNELFVRLPRLNKRKKTEVKKPPVYSFKTLNKSFHHSSIGQKPHSHSKQATSTIFKPRNAPENSSRKNDMNASYSKESDSSKLSGFPVRLHDDDDVKPYSVQDDDDNIDGFPMISDPPSKWDDDIDGRPLITESSENTKHTTDSIANLPLQRKTRFDRVINSPIRSTRVPSSHKPLKSEDDKIDGYPLRFRTNNLLNESESDLKSFPSASKPSGSSSKPETNQNDNKGTPFLKPDSAKIFKKPPDDWDKNAIKAPQTTKDSPFAKSKTKSDEGSDDQMSEPKSSLSDKYPNWKKGGVQGGTSFYNSPLYNKASEDEASNSNNAPVIDLFKRYRRVQL